MINLDVVWMQNILWNVNSFKKLKSVLKLYFTTLFGRWKIHIDNSLNVY